MPDAPDRAAVSVSIPVAWGEMDAFQHVNNVVYARWLETARIAYFERVGLLRRMRDEGVGPILARTVVDYRRPVTFPDTVRVDAWVSRVGTSSFTMSFRVWSEAQGAEVATGEQVIVQLDYRSGRATPLDDALRAAIASLEAPQA
jgi:acyl-CoA thioester hydrolase